MKSKGPVLLLCTAVLWGMAFVAQTTAAESVGSFTFNASRNFVGAAFLSLVIAARKRMGQDRPAGSGTYSKRTLLVAGLACGVMLCLAANFQQAGIAAYPPGSAASGRSGFVTATYMVMVAVMGVGLGKKLHPAVFAAVGVALLGMYMLCVPAGFGSIYLGDWLVLASALGYALHILVIDHYGMVDGVRLSRMQLLSAGTISLVCALVFEHPHPAQLVAALTSILYAGICSDGIAYTLQIVGQQTTDPTVASIIMSLESVFAALGGWLILNESLSPIELAGCALVFVAVLLAQAPDMLETRKSKELTTTT